MFSPALFQPAVMDVDCPTTIVAGDASIQPDVLTGGVLTLMVVVSSRSPLAVRSSTVPVPTAQPCTCSDTSPSLSDAPDPSGHPPAPSMLVESEATSSVAVMFVGVHVPVTVVEWPLSMALRFAVTVPEGVVVVLMGLTVMVTLASSSPLAVRSSTVPVPTAQPCTCSDTSPSLSDAPDPSGHPPAPSMLVEPEATSSVASRLDGVHVPVTVVEWPLSMAVRFAETLPEVSVGVGGTGGALTGIVRVSSFCGGSAVVQSSTFPVPSAQPYTVLVRVVLSLVVDRSLAPSPPLGHSLLCSPEMIRISTPRLAGL